MRKNASKSEWPNSKLTARGRNGGVKRSDKFKGWEERSQLVNFQPTFRKTETGKNRFSSYGLSC